MSIKFICSCGKHLRARETLAGKRSVCPQCGELIGVPPLAPTQRGTVPAPLSPAERARATATLALPRSEPPATLVGDRPPPAKRRRWLRRMRALEKRWYECLWFPLYAAEAILILAGALTALTGIAALYWPELPGTEERAWWFWTIVWVAPFVTIGYLCGLFDCVLVSAAAGETGFVRWPGFDLRVVLKALFLWLLCFVAGPILFAAAAFLFWYHAGDPTPLDWLIVLELCVVGAGHFLLALVAVHQSDRLRDLDPLTVGDVIRRLGPRAILATLGAVAVGFLFGRWILHSLVILHEEPILGWPILFASWLAGLAWLTFLFRFLGIWCFRSRVEGEEQPPAEASEAVFHGSGQR